MQVGFMMKKALGELFILKSTKPLPIIFNNEASLHRKCLGLPCKSATKQIIKQITHYQHHSSVCTYEKTTNISTN